MAQLESIFSEERVLGPGCVLVMSVNMISGMINLPDSIGCERPIYINILHSLRGQEHDINYRLSFFVPDLITKETDLGSGLYLSSGGGSIDMSCCAGHNNV